MLTPLDIQNTKFATSAIGYKKSEVDQFMTDLLKDYEAVYKKNAESSERIKSLSKMLESYKGMEETMKNTLMVAQSSAEQLTSSARHEADVIIAEAKEKSKEIISKANENLAELNAQYELLKKEIAMFILKTKAEFEVQIKGLDQISNMENSK